MISKSKIKVIKSLQQKKFRKEQGLFFAEGEKVIAALLQSHFEVEELYMTDLFFKNAFQKKYSERKIAVEIISEEELGKISTLTTPQHVLGVVRIPKKDFEISTARKKLTLVLDDISDPGNLGTIIRTADWFGIKNIICSSTTTDAFSSKVVQASMGSLFRVNIFYEDLKLFFEKSISLTKLPIFGALLNGENIFKSTLSDEGFILIGNESEGISDELKRFITCGISIPAFSDEPHRSVDSLNAAVATSIICSEFRRRF